MTWMTMGPWEAYAAKGADRLRRPTGVVLIAAALAVVSLLAITLALDGIGAWVLRVVGVVLAVPVVLLAVRRQRLSGTAKTVTSSLAPHDTVVQSQTADGRVVEVVVQDARQVGPMEAERVALRQDLGGTILAAIGSTFAGGIAATLVLIIAIALAVSS